jgi:Protein of unknown function (DUF2567)
MSLSGEEQSGPMSLSGEEQSGPMSLSGEEQSGPMSLSGEEQSPLTIHRHSAPTTSLSEAEPPHTSLRRAVTTVVIGLVFAGVLVGAIWAWIAPPVQGIVALTRKGDRVTGYLGDESDHLFLGALVMTGLLVVLAVVAATWVWQWRAHRGPVMVAALAIGSMAAAGVATGVGAALARWRYGSVDVAGAPVTPEHRVHYVTEAPAVLFGHSPLQVAALIVVPAGVAAFVYAMCSLTSPRDDLGAWPPVEPVFFTGPARTAVDVPLVDPSSPSH